MQEAKPQSDTPSTAAPMLVPDGAEATEAAVTASTTNNTIKTYVIAAMALGLVPVPVFDIVAVMATQLKMIHALSKEYKVAFNENLAKSSILALAGGVLPIAAGSGLASLLKLIPGLGSLTGAASVSLLAGALTFATGKVFVQHFESGGTLLDFDPSKVRKRFREEYERGKAYVCSLKGSREASEGAGQQPA